MNYLLCICMSMDNMLRNVTYFKRSDHPKWTQAQLSLDLSAVSDLNRSWHVNLSEMDLVRGSGLIQVENLGQVHG